MLSLFPSLFMFERLSPFIIRLALGVAFIYFGYRSFKNHKKIAMNGKTAYSSLEIAIGVLVIIGLYTQLAALIMSVLLAIKLIFKIKTKDFLTDGVNYYLLLFVMAFSLLITGAGFLAFDLPI